MSRTKRPPLQSSPKPPSPRSHPLSPHKRFWFRLIALLLPVLLLALVELGLRLWGLGGYPPMMRRIGSIDQSTLVIADQGGAASWFFANPQRAGICEQAAFLDSKPTNTTRIFLVGESAIKGYPQPRNLASSAFLEKMLRDVWPERHVEVINLGTTAIASYPVLGIMTEALDHQPDLMVISTGNNEFFGTYGVASSGRAGSKPWMMRATRALHSLAIVQAFDAFVHSKKSEPDRTLMEAMIGQSFVGPDDWQRAAAASNLHHNVAAMIKLCQARNIPVLVCTQPSNESGLAPVGAEKITHLPSTTQTEITSLLSTIEATRRGNPETNRLALQRLIELHPNHARAHFLLGETLARQGQSTEALAEFVKARDLDSMPWRTPTASQQAILNAAQEHGTTVCDLVKAFRAASTNGMIGWELMDDHVHPTLRGQALIAETIVNSLTNFTGPLRVAPEAIAKLPAWDTYARQLGDNIYDQYGIAYNMRSLFAAAFMRANNPDAYERFNQIAEKIEKQMPADIRNAMREWQTTRPFDGSRCPITAAVAQARMKRSEHAEALELFQIAQRGVAPYTSWYLEYTYYALLCKKKLNQPFTAMDKNQAQEAIQQGRFLLAHGDSANEFTDRYTGLLYLIQNEFAEAIPFLQASREKLTGFDRTVVDQTLAICYLQTRQFDKARDLARAGVARADQHSESYAALLKALPELEKKATTNATMRLPDASN